MTSVPRYSFRILYDVQIIVRDGVALSANLWLPEPVTPDERFPAILEMIPYRKDDWRFQSDHERMGYFAQRGFACCRLDIRGTGSSGGIARDEYTAEETNDGYDAVEWLAAQPWCNGSVGMWGISYGGFTAIQVAMLQPPALKAIVPMYATDDRYTDDVHYLGGCTTASELAQYALGMVAMNAMPPRMEYAGADWAARWKERLEQTPAWLIEWLHQQTDGPYWRQGSLAPDYTCITCAILNIGGWADSYVNAALRMQHYCSAPSRTIIGPWVHSLPDSAYPGPNIDYLHEMVRFFSHWLTGTANGVMEEPPLTYYMQEYTPPEAFPVHVNGAWQSEYAYPAKRAQLHELFLDEGSLTHAPPNAASAEHYSHRPTIGTSGPLCYGAGSAPNGLARDLRPDEALCPTYTSAPLTAPLDVLGMPEVLLYLSATAPQGHVVVRLADVAPDGTSAHVSTGFLNLTHREGHSNPQPLVPGKVYAVRVPLRAIGYRFLPGHRVRISVMSACWPIIFPSPLPVSYTLHRSAATPSRLILPILAPGDTPVPPVFKTTPAEIVSIGGGSEEPAEWRIVTNPIARSVQVQLASVDTSLLPDGRSLSTAERITLTAYEDDPTRAHLFNEEIYTLREHGYQTHIVSSGSIRAAAAAFHVDIQLEIQLNGRLFFQKSWIESIPRA